MKVSPGEVYDLYNEGLSIREIARRLKISRPLVNFKLREYELDKREFDLDNRKRELDIQEAELEARKKEMDKIPELEEKAHSLESKVHLLNSEVDSLTKERDELEREIRSHREVFEEIKDFKERREEAVNQLSELSNRVDIQKRSLKKLEETHKQYETESFTLLRIKYEIVKNRKENMRLVDYNKHLDAEIKVKKNAINEIEQSYYGYIDLTKQIALFMPGGSDTKTKTHEEIREKVLLGMEIIAKKAKITKPDSESESELQAFLRDPSILKRFFSRTASHENFKE